MYLRITSKRVDQKDSPKTLLWQWMRLPGDVLFAMGALLMAWDFVVKLGPLYPAVARRL
jgi:nitric oxide reductase subunit B